MPLAAADDKIESKESNLPAVQRERQKESLVLCVVSIIVEGCVCAKARQNWPVERTRSGVPCVAVNSRGTTNSEAQPQERNTSFHLARIEYRGNTKQHRSLYQFVFSCVANVLAPPAKSSACRASQPQKSCCDCYIRGFNESVFKFSELQKLMYRYEKKLLPKSSHLSTSTTKQKYQ